MKAYFLFTCHGPLVILTSYDSIQTTQLLNKLHAKGIEKFVAHEVPIDLAKQRYGRHFDVVVADLHETDDLRVLDYSGERALRMFSFKELGTPVYYE
jgi:predicted ABC-type ATPase